MAFSRKMAANSAARSLPETDIDVLIVGEPLGQAAHADHGGQRHDERLDAGARDHRAVQRSGQRPRAATAARMATAMCVV